MNIIKAYIKRYYWDINGIFMDGKHQNINWKPYSGTGFQVLIEGSLEVKLPTLWTDEKQRWEESERREE